MKNKETQTNVLREKEWYKEEIVNLVGQIENLKFLKRIYISLRDYISEK